MSRPDPAAKAIAFALSLPENDERGFLRMWAHGDFPEIRAEWPNAPEGIYIGADDLHPQTVLEGPSDLTYARYTAMLRSGAIEIGYTFMREGEDDMVLDLKLGEATHADVAEESERLWAKYQWAAQAIVARPQTVLEDPHPPARQAMPLAHPPSHWDEWAMRRSRQLVQEINDVNHPPGQLTARLHCLLVDAMYYAAGEGDEDTARLGFIQANPDLSLRNLKNGRYWSLDGFSNYPQDTHHDVRAAIDAARREKDATP